MGAPPAGPAGNQNLPLPPAFRRLQAASDPAPVATRTFRSTDRVLVDLAAVSGAGQPPVLTVELLGSTGQMLAPIPLPAGTGGRARFELPVSRIAPATYALRITATAGAEKAERLEAFRIVP